MIFEEIIDEPSSPDAGCASDTTPAETSAETSENASGASSPSRSNAGNTVTVQEKARRLERLDQEVKSCHKCPLADGRTNTVFGDGNPNARILFIGEAPGKNEDLQGVPFVGAAGNYLNDLLASIGVRRQDVYIANILKCRPPGNRNPQPEEIQICTPYLREQTRIINPEFIVTLGNFSTKFVLKTEQGITRLHGKVHKAGKFKVFPVFHPAACLYDSKKRIDMENDFQTLGELLRESDRGCSS